MFSLSIIIKSLYSVKDQFSVLKARIYLDLFCFLKINNACMYWPSFPQIEEWKPLERNIFCHCNETKYSTSVNQNSGSSKHNLSCNIFSLVQTIVPRDRQLRYQNWVRFQHKDIRRKQVFSKETRPVIVIIHV